MCRAVHCSCSHSLILKDLTDSTVLPSSTPYLLLTADLEIEFSGGGGGGASEQERTTWVGGSDYQDRPGQSLSQGTGGPSGGGGRPERWSGGLNIPAHRCSHTLLEFPSRSTGW